MGDIVELFPRKVEEIDFELSADDFGKTHLPKCIQKYFEYEINAQLITRGWKPRLFLHVTEHIFLESHEWKKNNEKEYDIYAERSLIDDKYPGLAFYVREKNYKGKTIFENSITLLFEAQLGQPLNYHLTEK